MIVLPDICHELRPRQTKEYRPFVFSSNFRPASLGTLVLEPKSLKETFRASPVCLKRDANTRDIKLCKDERKQLPKPFEIAGNPFLSLALLDQDTNIAPVTAQVPVDPNVSDQLLSPLNDEIDARVVGRHRHFRVIEPPIRQ